MNIKIPVANLFLIFVLNKGFLKLEDLQRYELAIRHFSVKKIILPFHEL